MKYSFPFAQRLSLTPLLGFWQSMADKKSKEGASFIDAFLKEIRDHPTLNSDNLTQELSDSESRLVGRLMSAIFPMATIPMLR